MARPTRARARRPAGSVIALVLAIVAGSAILAIAAPGPPADGAPARSLPNPQLGLGSEALSPITGAPSGPPLGRVGGGPALPGATSPSLDRVAPAATPTAVDVPACRFGNEPAPHAGLRDWASTIVDTDHALPTAYAPRDLVPVSEAGIGGWGLVRSFVIDDLRALAAAARQAGNPIAVQSAYRSADRQADVYAGWVAQSGEAAARRFSARPGHSEHELGTAIDVRAAAGGAPWSGSFGSTAAGRWTAAHAVEFGFVLSYPAGREDATCYGAEAWHLRYLGRERAVAVAASGLTLREWLFVHAGG